MTSGPSEKAIEAAAVCYCPRPEAEDDDHLACCVECYDDMKEGLTAAHDPALGLDRSVCLRDVVEALRSERSYEGIPVPPRSASVADFIEREFGSVDRPVM